MEAQTGPGLVYGSRAVLLLSLVCETATALAAILAPSILAWLLFGSDADTLARQVVRLAGIILLALVVAVWPGRSGGTARTTLALLLYNVLCALLLGYVALSQDLLGWLLWPAVVAHAAIAGGQFATRHPTTPAGIP